MLIEFRVANHRSILEEQVFTFEAGRLGDDGDPRPRAIGDQRLLPVAAIYGANASGKSNVLSALDFLRNAVLRSHHAWAPGGEIPREPFAWGDGPTSPSLFEVGFVLDGVRYAYGFVADDTQFLEEWLHAWPKGRRQRWFEREGDVFKFGDHLRGENRAIENFVRTNSLFLSTAAQNGHAALTKIYEWIGGFRALNVREPRPTLLETIRRAASSDFPLGMWSAITEGDSPEIPDPGFRELLHAADFGIEDYKEEFSIPHNPGARHAKWTQILLKHAGAPDAWLPLDQESAGTQELFRVGPVVLDALANGSVLLVDELERSLHPLLALRVIDLFNNPATNPRNAQLLFTTHDTNLLGTTLGEPALRRDQVWLTEKDPRGATHLYPLTDFKPRNSENIERGYLQGRYGAVPFLGPMLRTEE